MPNAFAIFREEGEFSDHQKELLAIALTSDEVRTEVTRQAEKFVEEQRVHTPQSTPIEILGSTPNITVRIGKMGWGPRDVLFHAEEAPLASK